MAHQNSSVQPKVLPAQYFFEFRKIVLGDPLLTRGIHQECNLGFTDEIENFPEVMVGGPSGIFYGNKLLRTAFGWYVILRAE